MDTPCHKEGGCIRAFEDDTCGDQGQCSIVLAVMAERERCAQILMTRHENHPQDGVNWDGTFYDLAEEIRGGEK